MINKSLEENIYRLYSLGQWPKLNIQLWLHKQPSLTPLTPMSDQDRISPYNIDTISRRQVMRIDQNFN